MTVEPDDTQDADAFLRLYGNEQEPDESHADDEKSDAGAEDTVGDDADEGTEAKTTEGDDDAPEEHLADDEHLVVLKVGDEERKVPVKDLKDLFAREQAIKTRDTETQEALTKFREEADKNVKLFGLAIERADKRANEYAALDWNRLAAKMDDASYNQLRQDAKEAFEAASAFRQDGDAYVQRVQQAQQAAHKDALKACDEAVAKDPDLKGVTRADLKEYGKKLGMPDNVVDNMVFPWAIKALHKAMMFDKGQAKVATAVKNPAKTSTKTTLKPGSAEDSKQAKSATASAVANLRKSGSDADAMKFFMAAFSE